MTVRDWIYGRLLLVWARTLEQHRIADFHYWVSQHRPHVPPAGRTD